LAGAVDERTAVVARFRGRGAGVATFVGVGAGRPWMHWDRGRSHSSQ
jgi:hypothetical protein